MTPEERAEVGSGVKLIGRWHDMAARKGFCILEATDLGALTHYLGQWNPHMDLDMAPALDDEESAAAAKSILASHNV